MQQTRRDFLKQCSRALALAALSQTPFAAESEPPVKKRQIKKGIMWGTVGVPGSVLEKCKMLKEAGFEGFEPNSHMDQDEVLRARDATGLVCPSVCCSTHWGNPVSDPNPEVRAKGLDGLKQALRD